MKKLELDSGVEEFRLGSGGVLRLNPCDPNVYARFLEALEKLPQIERELTEKAAAAQPGGEALVKLLRHADSRVKALLAQVFPGNDLDQILHGVSLMAVAGNGERVVTNLVNALEPVLADGAERFAQAQIQQAKARRDKA